MDKQTPEMVKAFVCGDMDILTFWGHFQASEAIGEFLDGIICDIEERRIPLRRPVPRKPLAPNAPFAPRSEAERFLKAYAKDFCRYCDAWRENPPKVSAYLRTRSPLTSSGAYVIHHAVADVYWQIDTQVIPTEYYHREYVFCLDVLPGYLCGGITAEHYVSQHILPRYPATMKKDERKRLIREAIRQDFPRDCKSYPQWIQMPEWPIGTDGKPMVYTGQKNFEHHSEYRFRDPRTGEVHTVTQLW